jgi:response regulator RpfG family c-di-GMP phosphodiesterase
MYGFEIHGDSLSLHQRQSRSAPLPAGLAESSGSGFASPDGQTNSQNASASIPKSARVLVIDDDQAIRFFLQKRLSEAGYVTDVAEDGLQAMQMIRQGIYHLVVCDVRLPDTDGLEILRSVHQGDEDLAFIMVTAVTDVNVVIPALKAGAYDYLVKPFNVEEVLLSIERALEKRSLRIENRLYQQTLESRVLERTRELVKKNRDLSNLLLNTIESLVSTLEAKDTYTEGHSWKVALLAASLSRRLNLEPTVVENISLAGLLHDIGKIGVKDSILNKASKLTPAEYEHIRRHPVIGEKILAPLEPLRVLLPCVRHHHEWWNGAGYPDCLVADKIPLEARILTIADAYDAITSERAYRPARSRAEALDIISDAAGKQFDPEFGKLFIEMMGQPGAPGR